MDHLNTQPTRQSAKFGRLKITAALLTLLGLLLFGYFVYAVGFWDIVEGIERFGMVGFAVILVNYFLRICARAWAWKLAVQKPDHLSILDTVPAVIIGEALSSTIPLGILISGTSKAVAVRRRIPLVSGLSSVATENLFYSFVTGLFLILGAAMFIRTSNADAGITFSIDLLIGVLSVLIVAGVTIVIRQWHFASWICEWVYSRGFLQRILRGRHNVRKFEDLIYGFYRRYPHRFVPICLLQSSFHILGVIEVWFILSRIGVSSPSLMHSFLLESVSRLITILFKLVPFLIGVDEAGAQLVGEAVALAAGVGVTLAIIRKGRILFWTAVGMALILKRELSIHEIASAATDAQTGG